MRRALVVGIDEYVNYSSLTGCVNDAISIKALLARHEDGQPNFDCRLVVSSKEAVTRATLRRHVSELLKDEADIALLYFAGHGAATDSGGILVTQDAEQHDEGLPMSEVLGLIATSKVHEVIVLLDCCFSGGMGSPELLGGSTLLREGVSIMTASRYTQTAGEVNGHGVFTRLVIDALNGGAADVRGYVTVSAIYSYVDQTLGAWGQRPLLKAHVSKLVPVRQCIPIVEPAALRAIAEYFRSGDEEFALDPSFEPTSPTATKVNTTIFSHLQQYRAARLLEPVGEDHLYYAAINSKSCRLTPLGKFYRDMAADGKI